MSIVDPFGVMETPANVASMKALEESEEARDAMIVLAADVHLDQPATLTALRTLFEGFLAVDSVPAMVVLAGNFSSKPFGQYPGDRDEFRKRFDALADLIAAYPAIATATHFVLVPGPHDPGAARVLPRQSIPPYFVSRLLDPAIVARVTITTNPCRIRFFTQELVFFRADLSTRLRRRAIVPPLPPPPDKELHEHMIRTVIDQAHLCPLPLSVQPVYWSYDYALRLTATPDVLVVAEDGDPYEFEYSSAFVLNPGSFGADTAFMVYRPATREAEQSYIRPPAAAAFT